MYWNVRWSFFCKKGVWKPKCPHRLTSYKNPRQPTYLSLLEGTIYLHFVVIGTSKKVFLSKYIAWSGAFLTFWSECKNLTKLRNSTDGVTKIWRKCKNFWQFRLKRFVNMVRMSEFLTFWSYSQNVRKGQANYVYYHFIFRICKLHSHIGSRQHK